MLACAIALLGVLIGACSPYGGGDFACTEDMQCGAKGFCREGFCSFPDSSCDSGLRYGDLSGPSSNTCVGGDGMDIDGGMDIDTPPGQFCYGGGIVKPCFASMPAGDQMFGATDLDTDTDSRCMETTNDVAACVIAAETIEVNALFTAHGSKPLVFVATRTISIGGTLSVASSRTFNYVGAGAEMPGCNAGAAPTGNSGGAGGSFGGTGGAGAAVGGNAGTSGAVLSPASLRGGCPGQTGGDAAAPTGPGAGGQGGGALYLIAEQSITVATGATINASGAGARGGASGASGGGGGGGSGGFIGLDSPMLSIAGAVLANGGGGGEASGAQSTGTPGGDALGPMQAQGGAGGSNFGTDGGDGAFGTQLDGQDGAPNCTGTCTTPSAGGGGGGGAGIIKRYRASSTSGGGTISPPIS